MRRRSRLITPYLRANDPLGTRAPLSTAAPEAGRVTSPRPRVRRVVFGGGVGGLAITAAVAISLAGWLPGAGDSPLSPQEAVAAVADDLRAGQIVHWRADQEQLNPPSSPFGRRIVGTIDVWSDTRTGASHMRLDFPSLDHNPAFDDESGQLESWFDGDRTTWTSSPAPKGTEKPSRTKVGKIVSPKPLRTDVVGNPLDDVRRSLDQADRGKATFTSEGTWHGSPVIKVTTRDAQTTSSTWIARTKQPRLLKTVVDSRYPDGSFLSHTVTTTTVWDLYPVTDESARRRVAVPNFDPERYVVTDPLGPTP